MKKYIFLLVSIMCPILSISQTVKVSDKTTLQPLSGVTIFNTLQKLTTNTNLSGKADISEFKNMDSIWFSHVGYSPKMFSYSQLSILNFSISLSEISLPLGEIVISASRFEESVKDVAQPVMVIKAKELAFMNQQTTADVIQNTGNVMVQKSQLGGGSPVIRGFETNKVLMVIDGVRMNNAIYRGGHIQNILSLDNAILDKAEVIFGPGSVVYGSDALGGVMHFHTKKPQLADTNKVHIAANAFTRFATAASEKSGHLDFTISGKKFGSLTSFTASDFGDLRQGGERNPFYGDWGKRLWYVERVNGIDSMRSNSNPNIQKQSGYSQYDLLQKFLFKQNNNVTHILNLQYSTSSDIPRYDRLTLLQGNNPRFAEWYYGPQNRLFSSYEIDIKSNRRIVDQAKVVISYQQVEESRHDRRFRNNNRNVRTENLDIVTINADYAKRIWRHEVRYGLDGWYNQIKSTAHKENILDGTKTPLDTRYPDGGSDMQSAAGYITHSWEINDKLIINDGVRLNQIFLNATFNDTTFFPFPFNQVSQKHTSVNGNLGLVYMPGADWRFTLLGSSGFRAPNVDDLSKVFESNPGQVIVPNPDLKPEYTYNLDLGISKTINEEVTIGATGFYTLYKDAITTQPGKFNGQDSILYAGQLSQVKMSVNEAEAFIYGFNGYINAEITEVFSISSTLNYTYARIKTDSIDYPLDHIPPVFGKTSLNIKLKKLRSEIYVQYHGAKKSKDYNLLGEDNQSYSADPLSGYMPSWITLNLRTAYQINRYIGVQLALENILDQNYRIFASNISAPGRNFVVTLRGNF